MYQLILSVCIWLHLNNICSKLNVLKAFRDKLRSVTTHRRCVRDIDYDDFIREHGILIGAMNG